MTEEGAAPDTLRKVTDGGPRPSVWGAGLFTLWREAWPAAVLLLVIWICFAAQEVAAWRGQEQTVRIFGSVFPPAFRDGVWWTPVTHIFLHGGLLHILMNSSALIALAPVVSQRLGRDAFGALLFLAFFLICGVAGAGLFLVLHWGGAVPMIGASGAICGLWGAVARLTATPALAPIVSRQVGRQVRSFVIMNLILVALGGILGLASGQGGVLVAWEAHVGGFIAGLLLIDVFPVRFWWLREDAEAR